MATISKPASKTSKPASKPASKGSKPKLEGKPAKPVKPASKPASQQASKPEPKPEPKPVKAGTIQYGYCKLTYAPVEDGIELAAKVEWGKTLSFSITVRKEWFSKRLHEHFLDPKNIEKRHKAHTHLANSEATLIHFLIIIGEALKSAESDVVEGKKIKKS